LAVGAGFGTGVAVGAGVGIGVGVTVGAGVGLAVGVAVGEALGQGVAESRATAVGSGLLTATEVLVQAPLTRVRARSVRMSREVVVRIVMSPLSVWLSSPLFYDTTAQDASK